MSAVGEPGPVESAVRARVKPGASLPTPTGRGQFTIASIDGTGIVLLLGQKEARTPISWACLEGVPQFLRGRGWVPIAGTYDTSSAAGTLDAYLKQFINRATAGWVAVILERAGIVVIDRGRPAAVKLRREAADL
jgi:hypothetical protein